MICMLGLATSSQSSSYNSHNSQNNSKNVYGFQNNNNNNYQNNYKSTAPNATSVFPYTLTEKSYPKEGYCDKLFIPVPKAFLKKERLVDRIIQEKLELLVKWNVLPKGSYTVYIPLKSRESGEIKSGCIVEFTNVGLRRISMARIMLNDSYWEAFGEVVSSDENRDCDLFEFKCHWATTHGVARKRVSIPTMDMEEVIEM